jgi:hypothetical protein
MPNSAGIDGPRMPPAVLPRESRGGRPRWTGGSSSPGLEL